MPDLLVRIAKPGQEDHYVPRQRAQELEDNGWTIITEESLTAPERLAELALRVLELQQQVDNIGPGGGVPEARVEAIESEVADLGATIQAPDPGAAPKPTPRTDALEAWRAAAEAQIAAIQSTVAAIDVPAAVSAWLAANPPPAGTPGADGKSAYQLARDAGYGGTQTQWLASLVGAQGVKGDPGTNGTNGAPGPNLGRRVVVSSAALTANTAKTLPVTWPSVMPDTNYAVSVTVEHGTPQQFNCSLLPGSKTTTGCSVVVRSTAAVSAPGVNVHVIGLA